MTNRDKQDAWKKTKKLLPLASRAHYLIEKKSILNEWKRKH